MGMYIKSDLSGPEDHNVTNILCKECEHNIYFTFLSLFFFFIILWELEKVNYGLSEAEGKLYLRMEERDFNVTAMLTVTRTSYTNVIEVIQTMSQVGTINSEGKRQAVPGLFLEYGVQDAGCQTVKIKYSSSCCELFCP